jgi:hypothetical protein
LIRAHALLHQASRRKDGHGHLVAEIADYAAVRELVAELIAEGAEVAIKPEVRETVRAIEELMAHGREEVKQTDIKRKLKLDKSVVSRRVSVAIDMGLLRNLEDRKGRPARLVLGDSLPEEIELLPEPERLHGCTIVERDEPASSDSANTGRCIYCGKGETTDDPLLTASACGHVFLAHRTCLDREWQSPTALSPPAEVRQQPSEPTDPVCHGALEADGQPAQPSEQPSAAKALNDTAADAADGPDGGVQTSEEEAWTL